MNKSAPVAWYWAGVGRRVELQRPTSSNSANWKPLYLAPPQSRDAELEAAMSEAIEALAAINEVGRTRRAELVAVVERMRRVLDAHALN